MAGISTGKDTVSLRGRWESILELTPVENHKDILSVSLRETGIGSASLERMRGQGAPSPKVVYPVNFSSLLQGHWPLC